MSGRCHYRGRLASNNAIFDSSYERGRPLSFKIGVRQVIAGEVHPCMINHAHPESALCIVSMHNFRFKYAVSHCACLRAQREAD